MKRILAIFALTAGTATMATAQQVVYPSDELTEAQMSEVATYEPDLDLTMLSQEQVRQVQVILSSGNRDEIGSHLDALAAEVMNDEDIIVVE